MDADGEKPAPRVSPLFNVVLVAPQIPNNTGNIGRTCVATGAALHLVHPLAFDTSEKACRRAGLDYWPRLQLSEHASWDAFTAAIPPSGRTWLFSTKGNRPFFDCRFERGDFLIFGNETQGLPEALLRAHPNNTLTIPMVRGERSLNLATAVCTVVYEGVRQVVMRGEIHLDSHAGLIL